jgi:hypothetical protein
MTPNEACLLSCEDEKQFTEFRRGLDEAHQPANLHEHILVEEFAQAAWELRRVRRIDRDFWEYVGGHYNRGEAGIAQALFQEKESRFRTHLRLKTQAERSYYRALDALERMHRDRDRQAVKARREIAAAAPRAIACNAGSLGFPESRQSAPPPDDAASPKGMKMKLIALLIGMFLLARGVYAQISPSALTTAAYYFSLGIARNSNAAPYARQSTTRPFSRRSGDDGPANIAPRTPAWVRARAAHHAELRRPAGDRRGVVIPGLAAHA